MGAHFTMALAKLRGNASLPAPSEGVERLVFVVEGTIDVHSADSSLHELQVDGYAYFPPGHKHSVEYVGLAGVGQPRAKIGYTDDNPALETPGEVFGLKKLLPTTPEYDFNIHVMDFHPGEYLMVKELHYNQHGLALLEGRGIYRLGSNWYPVQAGDVIWMAPYVPQWYAALGSTRSRYLLYKDVNRDPLSH
eukprot:jgi/Chlat1/912/Chrsp108S01422